MRYSCSSVISIFPEYVIYLGRAVTAVTKDN